MLQVGALMNIHESHLLATSPPPLRRLPHRLAPFISFVVQQPMPYHMIDHRKDTLSSARYM